MVPSKEAQKEAGKTMPKSSMKKKGKISSLTHWVSKGTPWVWFNAGAVAISVLMVVFLVGLIAARGLVYFWPKEIVQIKLNPEYTEANVPHLWAGNIWSQETVPVARLHNAKVPEGTTEVTRYLVKTGNRDLDGFDFRWLNDFQIESMDYPAGVLQFERREWGNFYGTPVRILENASVIESAGSLTDSIDERLDRALGLYDQAKDIEVKDIGKINYQLENLRLEEKKLELDGEFTDAAKQDIEAQKAELNAQYQQLQQERQVIYDQLGRDSLVVATVDGREKEIPFSQLVSYIAPNTYGYADKIGVFAHNLWMFLTDEPREANTEGGVFPAIFGTVIMVLLMSLLVTPFGVIAAVYLREYAKQGIVTRTVRIAVNNLAGVPSIVYGVFGLGFFVYFLGGAVDDLFYPEAAPAPVFGTPGLMWASLTLALLTVPVVIVATEEGLSRIPRSLREGSYALGATKFETMIKVIIPMASPAIMTGMILAVARAAGEVAPLMLVGVVKLAPTLPLDGNAPFLHLDRKFMHLGFHIYDVGFQSPNVEAARPLVYATAGLLVAVIGLLNLTAVYIRNNLREKYKSLEM